MDNVIRPVLPLSNVEVVNDPGVPLAKVSTLEALTGTAMAGERFSMLLVGSFGILAVLLAAVGIYGVLSYSVAQRSNAAQDHQSRFSSQRRLLLLSIS